jgi:hypothetical protein
MEVKELSSDSNGELIVKVDLMQLGRARVTLDIYEALMGTY